MAITLLLSTSLRGYAPDYDAQAGISLEPGPGLTPLAVMERLGIPPKEVKVVMLNGKSAPADSELADGDRLGLFPAVGGG